MKNQLNSQNTYSGITTVNLTIIYIRQHIYLSLAWLGKENIKRNDTLSIQYKSLVKCIAKISLINTDVCLIQFRKR